MSEQGSETEPAHLLGDDIKWAIVFAKQKGDSNKKVAREVGARFKRPILTKETVKAIYGKFLATKSVSNDWSTEGRPRVLNEEVVTEIIDSCTNDRTKSVREHRNELQIQASRQSINRALLDRGYRAYRARKKPLLKTINITKRFRFAQQHRNWEADDWRDIVFSDESIFRLVNSNGRTFVRRTAQEALQDDTIQPRVSVCKSVVVWGAISSDGVGPLVRITGSVNGQSYLQTLRYRLKRGYPDLFGGPLIFQQDNAPAHRSRVVQEWLREKNIECLDWPPQSPDLNIIENVWNILKYELRSQIFETEDQLWEEIQRLWRRIPWDTIDRLYQSMPRRIHALRRARGKHIKY